MSGVIRDLRREISKHGTVDVLRKEIERKSTLREKQERLLAEENERTRAIAMELRARILDEKTSNEREKERLTSKLNSKRVRTCEDVMLGKKKPLIARYGRIHCRVATMTMERARRSGASSFTVVIPCAFNLKLVGEML